MESASSQSFDSDESEKCLQVESYDEHVLVDDEITEQVDLCTDGVHRSVEQSNESLPIGNAVRPYIGMEFKSRDDAREFYIVYGRHTGFTVRIHHNRRSRINNMVIGQDFVCSKEGFREKKYACRKDRVLPPPPITREGCPAMLRVALRDGEKWVVTKFTEEHNHSLMSPSKVPWRGSGKNMITEDEKDRRIRELTLELSNERQRCKRRCAAYQEQLRMILKDIEQHTDQLSKRVQDIVQKIKELENEDSDI
ncbi:FHY3/FAR1 family [Trema orientale]|uniref:FHY3/FAR1 family n=1 Tax=Trema orientale TaxID=63057 RepID=A0A2P5CY81_TREOI|nr:FHY3/FAR1 family [Trema orientale]